MFAPESKLNHTHIIDRLCGCGYHAYVVGGATRDMLSGCDPKDVDLVTNASPKEIELLFQGHDVKKVGKSFGVIVVDGNEVATFRHDVYTGLDARACQVTFAGSIEEDLSRRDLTINAMAFCDVSGDLIDPHNGREDLKKRIIRFVGNPEERIQEDPNRIVRACRFLAVIDGRFERKTYEALRACGHYVRDHVAPDRLRKEILKAMKIRRASRFFCALHDIGALPHIFPSMEACYNHPHGPHHLEDVFDHLMICGDVISEKHPLLKLTGYLHDVGKPTQFKYNPDKGHHTFWEHAKTGSAMVGNEMRRLRFSNKEVDYVSALVATHMRSVRGLSPKAVRRLLRTLNRDGIDFKDFLRLLLADRTANLAKAPFEICDVKKMLNIFAEENEGGTFSVRDLKVTGKDVMGILKIPSGPQVGTVLNQLFERVLNEGRELNSRETLLAMISDVKRHGDRV